VKFRRSLGFAWQGLAYAWREQQNLRLELLLLAVTVSLSLWLNASTALVLLSWVLVIAFEFINTAIELTLDVVSPGFHEVTGLAKDLSAAAVLVMACGAFGMNLILLLPPLLLRLGLTG
jgi:diacylglycerol kinase (ATP)